MTIQVGFTTGGSTEEVVALEGLAIDSLWVGGHVASPNPTPEAMMALARLTVATERVRVGTAILLLPLYAPAIIAKQVADLDRASGGQVTLGVGIGGEYPAEFRACQVPVAQRGRRTDEAIGLIRRLWSGEAISHPGPFYPMEDVKIHPAPVQPDGPPIVVAGRKEPAMRRAARLGDGWMPYLYSASRYAASVATIKQMAFEAGRDLSGFEWFAYLFVAVDDDGDRARQQAARFLGGTYRRDFAAMVSRVAVAGTAKEVTAQLGAFVEAGARHLIIAPASREQRWPMMRRLAEDIVPEVQRSTDDQPVSI
jgi:probable F420-dependent oxidoreductase